MESAELLLAELADAKLGTLPVQASQTIASFWLPRYLVEFRRAYPGIDVRLGIGNTAQVASAVRVGVAELGFVEGAVTDPELVIHEVARDQLLIVVSPDHPWAERTRVSPADLMESEWVLREPGSGTRSAFEQELDDLGVAPGDLRVALELPSNEAVRAAVEAGMGATAISASVVAPSIEAGLLRPVGFKLPERSFYVLHHIERYRSQAVEALLHIVLRAQAPSKAAQR
jgi:DNA-binding transcriptional LysR family regulator